jgi:hypothetical protein
MPLKAKVHQFSVFSKASYFDVATVLLVLISSFFPSYSEFSFFFGMRSMRAHTPIQVSKTEISTPKKVTKTAGIKVRP